jgi:hypothetical protein
MDIFLAIGFLTTQVSKSIHKGRKKLKQVLEYLYATMDLEYTLGAHHLHTMTRWVDASYVIHLEVRSHTGGMIPLNMAVLDVSPLSTKSI